MRFGTDVGVVENSDGTTLIYVTNAVPMLIKIPSWFSREDRENMLNAVKSSYLSAARRVLEGQLKD